MRVLSFCAASGPHALLALTVNTHFRLFVLLADCCAPGALVGAVVGSNKRASDGDIAQPLLKPGRPRTLHV